MMALTKAIFPVFHPNIPSKEIPRIGAMPVQSSAQRWSNILEDETLDKMCNSRKKKLKEAKNVLTKLREDECQSSVQILRMIDALQRLGIDYHFQDDVKAVLENQYNRFSTALAYHTDDLSLFALRFRLLRQEGYYVPADVFNKFKNKEGKFKQELAADIKGLMGLYEASQLSIQGENILDEAAAFSGHFLKASVSLLADHQSRIVANTLKHPHHRTLTRSLVGNFLHNFNHGRNRNHFKEIFKQLAQFDFNTLQSFHREEIVQVSKWWKEVGLSAELKFQGDKPLDWFIWPLACLPDPSLSAKRVELAKIISLLHLIDDVFEFVGTIDQLTLFVDSVNRWEIAAAEELPDCMKICLKALYDITNEIAYNMHKELGYNPKSSLQKGWARLCIALLEDARWLRVGKLPKAEEYLNNTIETSGVNVVLLHTFFLLNEGITKETLDIVNNNPGIVSSAASILRLCNDLTSTKFKDGDDSYGSYMLCYIKENPGTSVDDARKHMMNKISESWKQLNCQCLSPNPFSASFTKAALNVARLAPFIYEFDKNHSLPSLKENMKSLMFQRIPV